MFLLPVRRWTLWTFAVEVGAELAVVFVAFKSKWSVRTLVHSQFSVPLVENAVVPLVENAVDLWALTPLEEQTFDARLPFF